MSVLGKCPNMVLPPSLSIVGIAFPALLTIPRYPFGTALTKPNAPLLRLYRAGNYMLQ